MDIKQSKFDIKFDTKILPKLLNAEKFVQVLHLNLFDSTMHSSVVTATQSCPVHLYVNQGKY